MKAQDVHKMTVICNIQQMQRIIGVSISDTNLLLRKSYEELSRQQNITIEHYNQAVRNAAKA